MAAIANIWRASMEELGRSDRAFECCFTAWAGSVASQGAREHALLDAHESIARAVAVLGLTRWEARACVRLRAIVCRNRTALCSWSATKSDERTQRAALVTVRKSLVKGEWILSIPCIGSGAALAVPSNSPLQTFVLRTHVIVDCVDCG